MKTQKLILVVTNQVASQNSKINWPDLNYPNSGQTILRTIHKIDYDMMKIQLDGSDGPWFDSQHFPEGVGFYSLVIKTA